MPKVEKTSKLNRVARRVAATAPIPALPVKETKVEEEENAPDSQKLSRGQRKRQAKRDQYVRREKLILSSLMLKKQDDQKQRIDGLDAIREALMNTTIPEAGAGQPQQQEISYQTNKGKQRLVAEEVEHIGLVLQHPAFKANPFETIKEHLKNTLAGEKKKLELESQKRGKEEQVKSVQQKRLKKERLQGVKTKSRKRFKPGRSRS